ncbi:hypothetical protein [Intestinimonas butyriciproducens]|uniref:hypothetical protein n=1 Tax=Intestinimonas butyriciproducens TaxID=1297617 RepID=UPI0018CCA555|nr:hypothetical protein [Intestinimonas butyriciproducens]
MDLRMTAEKPRYFIKRASAMGKNKKFFFHGFHMSEQSPLCSDIFLFSEQKDVINPRPCSGLAAALRAAFSISGNLGLNRLSRFRAPSCGTNPRLVARVCRQTGLFFLLPHPGFPPAGIPGHDPPGIPFYLVLHVLSL